MRTLKLHYPTGHPYWQADEYEIQMPNGIFFDKNTIDKRNWLGGHRIVVKNDGIYYQMCGSSSGTGKINYEAPLKIIDASEYDRIEYAGTPLKMSQTLINDLHENQLP